MQFFQADTDIRDYKSSYVDKSAEIRKPLQ